MVQILLSSYNGEKYIREQLDSLLAQDYKDMEILIRDDGSDDRTVSIIEAYQKSHPCISWYVGENIGATESFFDLLKNVSPDADYIAFCDQDDVWLPDKISVAVSLLKKYEKVHMEPLLYCSNVTLTDKNLKKIKDNIRIKKPELSFGNAIIENVCVGCTCVFNRELYKKTDLKNHPHALVHDWWMYLVALSYGKVIYDESSRVLYRQHGGNVIGLDGSRIQLIKRQILSFKKFRHKYSAQTGGFLRTYKIDNDKKELALCVIGSRKYMKYRMKCLLEKKICRQGVFDNVLFKIMLFFGWL